MWELIKPGGVFFIEDVHGPNPLLLDPLSIPVPTVARVQGELIGKGCYSPRGRQICGVAHVCAVGHVKSSTP